MINLITAAFNADLPLFIWGQPGIGKSDFVRQAAAKAGWTEERKAFIDVRLSQMEPVDLRGLPVPDMNARKTDWLPPVWLPFEGSDWADAGVLFLDEASSASPSVQAAAYQLVLDRQLGEAKLKKGWRLVLAGNRVTDGGVAFRLAMPLANRMLHVEARPSLDDWTDWAIDSGIHQDIIGFVTLRPSLLSTFSDALKSKKTAFATPRSWVMVSTILRASATTKPETIEKLIAGAVGQGVALEFAAYRKLKEKLPDIDAVLQGKNVKCANKSDVRHIATLALAFRVIEAGEKDLSLAQSWSQYSIKWLDALDVKYAALFISVVLRKKNLCLQGAENTAWVMQHKDLIRFREAETC
ncbi:MAG: MoxR family ATPase [Zoogloeaceae bacterium]|jgi:MoxR-like ATPase|nr:MoxR family ATPase [Zoogloeaceae bacterium]